MIYEAKLEVYIIIHENAIENVVCQAVVTSSQPTVCNTLRSKRNGSHFAEDICKYNFINVDISIHISITSFLGKR